MNRDVFIGMAVGLVYAGGVFGTWLTIGLRVDKGRWWWN